MQFDSYLDRILSVIHKTQNWVFAGIAIPFVTKLAMDYSIIKATDALGWLENATFLGISGFSFCLLVSKLTAVGGKKIGEWIKNRVPPFGNFTDNQKQFLIKGYKTGEQKIQVGIEIYNKHWFKELEEKNYIKRQSSLTFEKMEAPTSTYHITKNAWKKIEQYVKNHDPQNR